ncbi:MAG: ATP-binding protein [Sulfurovum sp.]|nr:ATP-binding protein [Sulfurovum sp.]
MQNIDDYLLEVWGKEFLLLGEIQTEDNSLTSLLEHNRIQFCDYMSIVLSVGKTNVSDSLRLMMLQDALCYFDNTIHRSLIKSTDILLIQKRLMVFLLKGSDGRLKQEIFHRIAKLKSAEIIEEDIAKLLILAIESFEKENPEQKSIPDSIEEKLAFSYSAEIASMEKLVLDISSHLEDSLLLQKLEKVMKKIQDQRFGIGITGVMNAGKSTMLNALLGREILGTAVVPETANLTIIKYGDKPRAVVNFWSRSEWEGIEESAGILEGMKEFVTHTKDSIGAEFDAYLLPEGKSQEIRVDELPLFTSVEHSDNKCNLVKSVELYSDLEFVKNGVEIVDTPGLDDPVIQREEITKDYLQECDLLCHLMNVNQSATHKDIEFIIESLLYQHVAQLLIVITRIDTVTEDEQEEVIAYTKSSIKSKLDSLGKGAQFDALVNRIEFISIAGKMALLHRTGREDEAISAGYSLDKSGILQIEQYLRDVLFGNDSVKAQLIVQASKKEINNIIDVQMQSYIRQKSLLGKSVVEIEAEYILHQKQKEKREKVIAKLYNDIISSRKDLEEYLSILRHFVVNKLSDLQSQLKRRIMDDVRYELKKNKKKPTAERIYIMLDIGIRDGFIDLLRDYRHQFQKRLSAALDKIDRDFEAFSVEEVDGSSSANEFFGKYFDKLLLTDSNKLLAEQLNQAIAASSKKHLSKLDQQLHDYMGVAMKRLAERFWVKADVLNKDLIESFEFRCSKPLESIEEQLRLEESILKSAMTQARNSAGDTNKRLMTLEEHHLHLSEFKDMLLSENDR